MIVETVGLVAATWSGALFHALKTGVPTLDRIPVRGLVAVYLPLLAWREHRYGPEHVIRLGRAFVAILHNESRGDPRFRLGDTTIAAGPSVGITQVLRRTARDLGLFRDPTPEVEGDAEEREAYARLADNNGWAVMAGISVFLDKLDQVRRAGPDPGWDEIWSAVRRYNGSGPQAEAYRERAADFARRTWGKI